MNFNWETKKEQVLKSMRIPAQKKMEWLREMHEFMLKSYSKRRRDIFWKLRGIKN